MKIKITTLIVFTIFIFNNVSGQQSKSNRPAYLDMMQDMTINFYDVCAAADAYFKTINPKIKGAGYKPFQRWKNSNESRYFPTGNRLVDHYLPFKTYQNFKEKAFRNVPQTPGDNTIAWQPLGPNNIGVITGHYAPGLGRIEHVEVNRANTQQIYMGSRSGGLWRTSNEGQTWIHNTDFLPGAGVNTIAAKPTNFNSVLINVQMSRTEHSFGIYRSSDGGATFQISAFNPVALGFGGLGHNFRIHTIRYHPRVANLIFIGTNRGIFKSTDDLQTWTRTNNSWGVLDIEFHPTDNNIMYVYEERNDANKNRIHKSINQGTTFDPCPIIANNLNYPINISMVSSVPNTIFLGAQRGMWKSTDAGASFELVNNQYVLNGMHLTNSVPNDLDPTKIICGYVDLFRSSDSGNTFSKATWWSLGDFQHGGNNNQTSFNNSQVYVHADTRYLTCVNGVFYTCTDGFLCKSTNNGETWTRLNTDTPLRENYNLGISQSNNERLICGAQDNGTLIKNENGWIEYTGADGMEGLIQPLNDNWMMGSWQNGKRIRTFNGGQTNTNFYPNEELGAWQAPIVYDPNNQMTLYSFTKNVLKSTNFGTTWQYIGTPIAFNNEDIKHATIAETDSKKIIVTHEDLIELSTDGGITFQSIKNNLPNFWITDVVFDPKNDNTIIVTNNSYQNNNNKIYISTDSGATWVNITHNLGNMPINSVVIDATEDSNIYIGAEIGVYVKTMTGNQWQLFNTNLPNVAVQEMEINHGAQTLYATTWGRGTWKTPLRQKQNHPKIVHTTITQTPSDSSPKSTVSQFVTSKIEYNGNISSATVLWTTDLVESTVTPIFPVLNTIPMTFVSGNTWMSSAPIPDFPVGTKVYFRVKAVGANNDISETYKFTYVVRANDYCGGSGNLNEQSLFLTRFTCSNVNKITNTFAGYSYFNTNTVVLNKGDNYNATATANTTWGSNDYAVWIDYNQDKEFSSSERIIYDANSGALGTGNFTVPNDALLGTTRLRVRLGYWDGTDDNPCLSALGNVQDYDVRIEAALSNATVIKDESIKIYPNPFKNELTFEYEKTVGITFEIFDFLGKSIIKDNFMGSKTIKMDGFASGTYIVKFNDGDTTFTKKISKK